MTRMRHIADDGCEKIPLPKDGVRKPPIDHEFLLNMISFILYEGLSIDRRNGYYQLVQGIVTFRYPAPKHTIFLEHGYRAYEQRKEEVEKVEKAFREEYRRLVHMQQQQEREDDAHDLQERRRILEEFDNDNACEPHGYGGYRRVMKGIGKESSYSAEGHLGNPSDSTAKR
ncbi:hypothetical protein CC80DRAFT_566176 [Byssothecium circinans]|uniref:Uncharacterized protein n=1 Tax=Byssothecium circinans TaxID=147558 RepID=A0A6A5TRT0_9PLEO|nr:hypothetical protein CC80DRAFT_566176 [Byssothecium circinans]